MTPLAVLLVIGAYLAAGVPSGYILARRLRGIDIREYGSGNIGASNVTATIGARAGLLLGAYDCLVKGTLPVFIAGMLDQPVGVQIAVGLASMAGHAWSPYIRFTGGRGIGAAIGAMLGLAMFYEIAVLGLTLGVVGRLIYRDTGFWTFIALTLLPMATVVFNSFSPLPIEHPKELVYFSLGASTVALTKRLTANWERLPDGYSLVHVAFNRVLYDRDVSRKDEWTDRQPGGETARPSADG